MECDPAPGIDPGVPAFNWSGCGCVWWPGHSGARHVVWGVLSMQRFGSCMCGDVFSALVPGCVGSLALVRWSRCPLCDCEAALPLFRLAGGPFVRGDEINVRRWRGRRQAGGARNFDRYRSVTPWRQEKPPDLHECRPGGVGLLRRSGGDAVEGVVRQCRVVLGGLDGCPPCRASHSVDVARLCDALRDVAGAELMERGIHAKG